MTIKNKTELVFNKTAVFTDIHFGKKNNSRQHNEDCEEFVDWFIKTAQKNNAETAIFCGDWHDTRRHIEVSTLDFSIRCAEKIAAAFKNFYFIPGNHDLYYKQKRDFSSIAWARNIKNINVITQPTIKDNVAFLPWLVGDEWKKVPKIKAEYIFGHFELPNFLMNAMIEMPDHGLLHLEHFKNQKYVFSGHFHKRQQIKNVIYIGNSFPHNFSDAWDDERGMMLLKQGGEPEFVDWKECPKYRTFKLSQMLEDPTKYIEEKVYARVSIDVDINYEEAQYIRENYAYVFKCRDINLVPQKRSDHAEDFEGELKFETVDQIVLSYITEIMESNVYDSKLLEKIYNSLETKS